MCFSAEMSFGASVVITTIGVVAYKKAGKTPYRFLAMIPLMFGLHQFIEGFVWISSTHEEYSDLLQLSTYSFIVMAWLIWPFYLPFAMWKIEKDPIRKKIMLVLVLCGVFVISGLTYILFSYGVKSDIVDCSILYRHGGNQSPNVPFNILYLSTTVLPNLVSKVGKMWILGIINFITYFVSRIYFNERVISVWCFFAAISSVVILLIILDIKKSKEKYDSLNPVDVR